MQKWVGLLDCNNFFVSCERLFRPDLREKPVVVLSSNDGAVVARSKEIKDKGIPMGVPYFQIKDIIKDIGATTFSSHFALYRDISRRVFEAMRKELDRVEQYSVDEAFFILQGEEGTVLEIAKKVKDRVEREVGIPVSVGIARSKTQAKYANTVSKKTTGLYLLTDEDWGVVQKKVRLGELWGVGLRSAEAFKRHGLTTVEHLLALERRQVDELFGVAGVRLWQELQGIASSQITRKSFVKQSILHSRSFKNTTTDLTVLQDAVAYHIREAAEDLRAQSQKTKSLQVTLGTSRHGDYFLHGGRAVRQFDVATNDTFALLRAGSELLKELYAVGVP
ncbi:MAG: Y-family DNA polymerase, partial [Candidatus Pacebacteria bacterium]|nr:Y-family DNA polymerase [Candidatus Paceibacterota bacterium]